MKNLSLRARLKMSAAALCAFAAALCVFLSSCGYASTLDWAVDFIQRYYYLDVSEEAVREAGLENLSGNVLDIYSGYYTAEESEAVDASNAGRRSGIGVSYQFVPEGAFSGGSGVYIVSVLGNSPAWHAGLRGGTFVEEAVTSDGTVFKIESNEDFSSFIEDRADGENFTLVTDRGSYEMSRAEYTMSYCYMATAQTEWSIDYSSSGGLTVAERASSDYSFLPEGAAYISLSQFYGNAVEETEELMKVFNQNGFTSLILDLRNNGGGYVDVMRGLTYIFTANSPGYSSVAMYAEYKDGSRYNFAVDTGSPKDSLLPEGVEMTLLANNGTASASEALIGALLSAGTVSFSDVFVSDFSQSYLNFSGTAQKNARTYGKGIMQSTFTYKTGESLKLTVARIFWPDGTCIHDVGIGVAQGATAVGAEWSKTYPDAELERAVQLAYASAAA